MSDTDLGHAVEEARARPVVERRHPWRTIAAVVILLLVVWGADVILRNPSFEWNVVGDYLFHPAVMQGLWTTIWLTVVVTLMSIVFGVIVGAIRLSQNIVLKTVAWVYIWVFRSTPLLVQLLFWFNIGYLFPSIGIGLPWGPMLWEMPARDLIAPITAALLGLTLQTTSYTAEIIRGGIAAVPTGQLEAAEVLGISPMKRFLRIIIPQSMRSIIPSLGNQVIDTLKATSMISVMAVPDLLYSVQLIYNRSYKVVPMLMVATLWYIFITSVMTVLQARIEAHYARGTRRRKEKRVKLAVAAPAATPPVQALAEEAKG